MNVAIPNEASETSSHSKRHMNLIPDGDGTSLPLLFHNSRSNVLTSLIPVLHPIQAVHGELRSHAMVQASPMARIGCLVLTPIILPIHPHANRTVSTDKTHPDIIIVHRISRILTWHNLSGQTFLAPLSLDLVSAEYRHHPSPSLGQAPERVFL